MNKAMRHAEFAGFLFERDLNRIRLRCRDNACALLGWSLALAGAAATARSSVQPIERFFELVMRGDVVEIELLRRWLRRVAP